MNDALHDLLDDLASATERGARGLDDTAVRRVAVRVRRRRTTRHVGAGVATACAVGAVGLGVAQAGGSTAGPAAPGWRPTTGPTMDAQPSPGSRQPEATGTPAPWQAYFPCAEPAGVSLHDRPDGRGLTLAADEDRTATLGTTGDATVTATIPQAPMFALVADGVVRGYLYPDSDEYRQVTLTPDETAHIDRGVHVLACGTDPAVDFDVSGTYTAWPFVVVDVTDSSVAEPGIAVVVADPRTITLP